MECKGRVSGLVDFVLNLDNCSEDPPGDFGHYLGLEVMTEKKLPSKTLLLWDVVGPRASVHGWACTLG